MTMLDAANQCRNLRHDILQSDLGDGLTDEDRRKFLLVREALALIEQAECRLLWTMYVE